MQRVRVALGLLLAACAVWLILSPLTVAEALGRPHETTTHLINLRASWGGTLLGAGAFITWIDNTRPRRRFALGMLMWIMLGIGAARLTGFILDGKPDAWQWIWLIAEGVIALACAIALKRGASTREQKPLAD